MTEEVKKKAEPTPEEKLVELHTKFHELFKKTYSLHEKIEREFREVKQENVSLVATVSRRFKEQNTALTELASISKSTEDALLNVLLAIRQNEYLQAYYPAQHGYPDMNVVGSHPAKTRKPKATK